MADIEEVAGALRDFIGAQIYPSTPTAGASGANGAPTKIITGWPKEDDLRAYLAAGGVQVSVYEMPGMSKDTTRAMPTWYAVTPAPIGLSATISGAAITFAGVALGAVNIRLSTGAKNYLASVALSASAATVAAACAALVAVDQAATAVGAVLTVPNASLLKVFFGGATTLAQEVARTKQGFQITIWAPNQALRVATAKIVEPMLRALDCLTLVDGTSGMVFWERSLLSDMSQLEGEYRRDMILQVEFPIIETTDGYQIVEVDLATQAVPAPLSSVDPNAEIF